MNSPAYDIAQIITSLSTMPEYGTGLYASSEPATPDNTITVFDTGGFESDVAVDYQRPTVQVRVRNQNYLDGYAVIAEIKDMLHGSCSYVEGGYLYTGIWAMSDIGGLGYDTNGRALLTLNFRIHRTPNN
jgi:hypothetical protein